MSSRLLNWFRRERLESDLERELRYHVDHRIADFIAGGLPEDEARRRAVLEIGGVPQIQEEVRDVWLARWLRDFVYDMRFSARSYLRTPAFSLTAILSFALGIGATTAIYSLVDQVVLHSLPVRQPERLVLVDWEGDPAGGGFGSWNLMSYPLCRELQTQDRIFEGVLCRAATTVNLTAAADPQPVAAELVSGTYFSVLGVGPALGRVLGTDDDQTPGTSPFVVLNHDYWQARFAGDPAVVGRSILINQHPMTIVGVAARGFRGIDVGEVPALWIPATMSAQAIPGFEEMLDHRLRWMQILGRLRPDVTLPQARAALQPWFKTVLEEDSHRSGFPVMTPDRRSRYLASVLSLTPAPQGHSSLRRSLSQPLWVLFAATTLLLILACLNVAGLFLARGSTRAREISTRLALGASRGRIGRQLMADSLMLALFAGALGVTLAPLAMRALIGFLPTGVAANTLTPAVNWRLLLFAVAVSLMSGVLSGLAPAWNAGRKSLSSELGQRGGIASGGVQLRKILVIAQIAFSLILVIGSILFIRSLNGLLAKGPGFQTSSLISLQVEPRRIGYSDSDTGRLLKQIYGEFRHSPAFQSVAAVRYLFLNGGSWNNPMTIQGNERIVSEREVRLNAVTSGFFATLGLRLIAGRDFIPGDFPSSAEQHGDHPYRSAIVNEAFVKRYIKDRNPLGVLICQGIAPDARPDIPIIGVVQNFNYRSLRDESEAAFFPVSDEFMGTFYIRPRGAPDQALRSVRDIVHKVNPALPIKLLTVDDQVSRSLSTERMLAALSTVFGSLALFLSVVGLYGVMSFVVTRRTREIGIRIALGATGRSAIWLILREAIFMIAAGAAIAIPCAAALGHLVQSQFFGVTPTTPSAIIPATLVLALACCGAACAPAWRAARLNPTDALRPD
jgi:predicted permease